MNNNAKKYNAYKSIDIDNVEGEDIESYPQDSYVKPGDTKNVGKLDDYNKDKAKYDQQKAKIVLKESKIASQNQDKRIDDLIPSDIGNAIDNVFSTVDNLLNATGKLFFSGKKKEALPKPKSLPPRMATPVVQAKQQTPTPAAQTVQPPQVQAQSSVTIGQIQPVKVPASQVQAQTQKVQQPAQPAAKALPQPPVQPAQKQHVSSIVKPAAKKKSADEEVDNSPPVTRTTTISDLDLPIEILNDPDLVRYFDQMKLYEKKVEGGLCSKTQKQASEILKKGRWGKVFMISYDQLKINTITASADAGIQRFNGMAPVYKAMGRNFSNTEELRKAIEKDINMYIRNGEGSGEFHKFTYKVPRKK